MDDQNTVPAADDQHDDQVAAPAEAPEVAAPEAPAAEGDAAPAEGDAAPADEGEHEEPAA
ncbi:MAG TPA: hypothetical protein VLF21_02365 [Candidatus Saccharimonadales bacterium]|nr:hypothetical protein [Candidatus Saccharimonadales bacterium]